jgi:hypothetical protein
MVRDWIVGEYVEVLMGELSIDNRKALPIGRIRSALL